MKWLMYMFYLSPTYRKSLWTRKYNIPDARFFIWLKEKWKADLIISFKCFVLLLYPPTWLALITLILHLLFEFISGTFEYIYNFCRIKPPKFLCIDFDKIREKQYSVIRETRNMRTFTGLNNNEGV